MGTMSATTKCMTKPSLSLPASRKAVNGRLSSRVTIKTRANATRRTEVSKVVEKAALEFAQVAEGEPLLISIGWGALMASFSFSLCLVVWGPVVSKHNKTCIKVEKRKKKKKNYI